jgi:HEAT repeat protein
VLRDYREVDLGAAEEAALKAAKVETDGPALRKYLRGLIPDPARVAEAKKLIKQLGDDSFDVREKASEELVKIGRLAVPLLQAAAKDADIEVARRAEDCLQRIGEQSGNATAISAVRLLALKRPPRAVEALLEYLPSAEGPVVREIKAALFVLAVKDGKTDPALTNALDDKDPLRRKVAAAVLGKDGGAYLKEAGRRVCPRGLKAPRKMTYYQDGKKTTEMEVLAAEYFNRFDEKVFARP